MENQTIAIKDSNNWMEIVSSYSLSDHAKSWWQLINSVIPYFALWGMMVWSLTVSYWLTLLLSVFAGGFLVRIFILFHDCGHGSFFNSKNLNLYVGIFTGLLAFTPFHKWSYEHKVHHATVGNLDKRGMGDINTLTVSEFSMLSAWAKLKYRVYRNPIVLFVIAPFYVFIIQNRFTSSYMSRKEKRYVYLTNITLAGIVSLMAYIIGWKAFVLIQLPVVYIAAAHGLWLFYVQHQFENVVWAKSKEWNYMEIALKGSSYFKLPKILQWFTGNIGFHHIHHLGPRIPNYKLQKCFKENPVFQNVKPITFFSSLKTLKLRLYDENQKKLVGFKMKYSDYQ